MNFEPIELTPTVSPHWLREQEEYWRRGSRWSSPLYAKVVKQDSERDPDFHHQATRILADQGFSQPATARALGISERSVRSHLSKPSASLEAERKEIARRQRIETHCRTKQGRAPFDVWAYLRETKPPMVADVLGFDPWSAEDIGSATRDKVAFYLMDGGWSQSEIARLLSISKQTVSEHVQKIRRGERKRRQKIVTETKLTRQLIDHSSTIIK